MEKPRSGLTRSAGWIEESGVELAPTIPRNPKPELSYLIEKVALAIADLAYLTILVALLRLSAK